MTAPLRNNLHTHSYRCLSSNPATVRSSTRAPCTVLRSPNRCQRESRSPPVAGTQRNRNLLPQWQPRMHTLGESGPFGPSYTKLSRAKLMMEERAEWFSRVLLQHDTAELMRAQPRFQQQTTFVQRFRVSGHRVQLAMRREDEVSPPNKVVVALLDLPRTAWTGLRTSFRNLLSLSVMWCTSLSVPVLCACRLGLFICTRPSGSHVQFCPCVLVRSRIDGPGTPPTGTKDHTLCVVRALMPPLAVLPPHACHRQETGARHGYFLRAPRLGAPIVSRQKARFKNWS